MSDAYLLWPRDAGGMVVWWNFVAGRYGGANVLEDGPVLLAVRGVRPFAGETHELAHVPEYDDTGILLMPGAEPVVFPMATHAYQARSAQSPDTDGDGKGDVGSVRPGRYLMHDRKNGREVIFHVTMPDGDPKLPCWRDWNGDRFLSKEEREESEAARAGAQTGPDGTWADGILLHGGLDEPAGHRHRYSIGCLTASLAWRELLAREAKDGKMVLLLLEAEELTELARDFQRSLDERDTEPPLAV